MDHEPRGQFGCIQTDRTRGYPIDAGQRRAYRVKRGGGCGFPLVPAPTDRLLRNGMGR